MSQESTPPDFLDLACLAYKGADAPARWARAVAMLSEDPTLGTSSMGGAAATGDVAAMRVLLASDPQAHSALTGARNWPPLLYLCYARIPQSDAVGTLGLLLESGADPNARFEAWGSPFTAITGAIGQGEQGSERLPGHPHAVALVKGLLEAGADPNDAQALYNTMLGGDLQWLRLLLAHGLTAEAPVTWMSDGSRSLDFVLANAVDHGDLIRVDLLLAHGADPNCKSTYNKRPVHTNALLAGHDEVAERLVASGARATVLGGVQKFQRALAMKDLDAARRLLTPEAVADVRHLISAADRGDLEVVQMLLDHGAEVNGTDTGGATALHKAAWADRVEVVRLLLKSGADRDLREKNHDATALGFALHNGSRGAATLLGGGQESS